MTDGEFKMHFTTFQMEIECVEDIFEEDFNNEVESIQEAIDGGRFDAFFYIISESLDKCLPRFAEMNKEQVEENNLEGWWLTIVR